MGKESKEQLRAGDDTTQTGELATDELTPDELAPDEWLDGSYDDESESIFETPEQNRTKIRAIRILGNRQMSSQAMERRLLEKGESETAARDTVRWLEDTGAINDAEYAASIVNYYSSKGYGLARIRNELFKRGIPRDLWDETLAILNDAETDESVYRFLEKKLRGLSADSDPAMRKNELRQATQALIRRGFSYEEARTAVGSYLESIENTEEN